MLPPNAWSSAPPTPTLRNFYAHEDYYGDDYHQHQAKKSLMTRVKERAKKWRQVLVRRRSPKREDDNATPPWGVSLEEADEEDDSDHLHGAPRIGVDGYEDSDSEKNSTIHYPSPCTDNLTAREAEMKLGNDVRKQPAGSDQTAAVKDAAAGNADCVDAGNKSLGETVTDSLAPAYAVVSEATQAIASRIQESARPSCESAAKQVWEKGVSMKEYLLQKLEPTEEDRALCQVITSAVSPRTRSHEFAEAGAFGNNEALSSLSSSSSSSMAKEVEADSAIADSPIPISTNPHSG
ncbi:hypothetical protein Cni_G25298 [Canna indica]|uniref:LTI65/LTI78 PGEED repeat domain-containing protein n=1 Tax=Canna indica TaxID=4628 RepID=A0AAQ3L1N1_9LILI|nr:hypothetical protein Cni_G25298 [Canna indica]